jgi:hypothetical protein
MRSIQALFLVCGLAIFSTSLIAQACPDKDISLDHVIWAVPDLAAYALKFEEMTGVKPQYGGEHTNGVTANYLVALGACTYLEIVGPKSGIDLSVFGDAAGKYRRTAIIGFAFGAQNIEGTRQVFAAKDITTGAPREGGRNKPDGSYVGWRTINYPSLDFGSDSLVFAIEWLTQPHPATTSPKGVGIEKLSISGVSNDGLQAISQQYAMPIEFTGVGEVNFTLTLSTPKGEVVLD